MTFLLCYVVYETAVNTRGKTPNAIIAIGFAVFLAHLLLLPIDGCSINPTRSTGPAIVSSIRDCPAIANGNKVGEEGIANLWVMWVGPLIGGALAAALQYPFLRQKVTS